MVLAKLDNIPDELKAIPNWVNWKQNKVPVISTSMKAASSTDKATWSEYDKAKAALSKRGILGLGFVLTNSDDLVVIDIDDCLDGKGNISPIADFWVQTFDSYTEVSPSGKGIHIFVRGPNIGTGKNLSKSYSASSTGFEIYCTGRYFTVTGEPLKEYGECGDIVFNACAVHLFYNTYFKKGRKENIWKPCDGPLEEGSRNVTLQATVGYLARMLSDNAPDTYDIEEKEDFLETVIYHLNDDYIRPPLNDKEIGSQIGSAIKYLSSHEDDALSESSESAIDDVAYDGNEEFNPREFVKQYAFVTGQNKFLDKENGTLLQRDALDTATGHMKFYKKTKDGRRQISLPEYIKLSASKTVVYNITWSPKREQIYTDSANCKIFNTYRPLSTDRLPVKPGDISMYKELLNHVIPDQEQQNIFMDYMAFTLQRPEIKINYSILLGSEYEGVGKDMLLRPIVNFMGDHCKEITTEMLHSSFNQFMYGSKLIIIQEIYTSNYKDKKETETKLKIMAAAPPDSISVNMKNVHPVLVDNICSVVATTNHEDALPITNSDTARRYFALWCEAVPKTNDFYIKLAHWFKHDAGLDKVVAHLFARDVSNFNYNKSPLKTSYLETLSDASKDQLFHRIKLMKDEGDKPFDRDLIKVNDIISAMDDSRLNPAAIQRALGQLGLINLGSGKKGNKKKVIKVNGKPMALNIYVNDNYEKYRDMTAAKIRDLYEKNHPTYSQKAQKLKAVK